jgi:hypothetical protein
MSLQNWLQTGQLANHQATIAEVRNLLGVVDRELADASVAGLSMTVGSRTPTMPLCCFVSSRSTPAGLRCKNAPPGIMDFGSIPSN